VNGTNANAFCVRIDGCTNVGDASVAAVPSAANAAVTPSDATPFHVVTVTVSTLARLRIGFSTPVEVRMMLGSSANGIANWPADPVVTFRFRSASTAVVTRTASTSARRPKRIGEGGVADHGEGAHTPCG
jgi:hypothetical protein